jgi:hypothetical protein
MSGRWLLGAAILLAGCLPAQGQERGSREFRVDFQGGRFESQQLKLIGIGVARCIKPEPAGLRIAIPQGPGTVQAGFSPRFPIHGDFEITASFASFKADRPDKGYGVGPCIYLITQSPEHHGASVSRYQRTKEGSVFAAQRAVDVKAAKGEPKREQSVRYLRTTSDTGKLRLLRSGKMLSYWVAEGPGEQFRQITEYEFTDAPLESVTVTLRRNDATVAAEVVWKDFAVRSWDPQAVAGKGAGAGTAALSGKSLFGLLGVAVVAVAGGYAWWRRRRRKPEPVPAADPSDAEEPAATKAQPAAKGEPVGKTQPVAKAEPTAKAQEPKRSPAAAPRPQAASRPMPKPPGAPRPS